MSTKNPPNVLMVIADQHNASLMGCEGHPQAITPNFDRFAEGGVRFTNAYCQNPICTPSRTCILSGQYCHNHGTYGLSGPANHDLPNLFRHFKANGYRTAGFGKLHLPNDPHNWILGDVDRFEDTYETLDGTHGRSNFLTYLDAHGVRQYEDSWHNPFEYGDATIVHDAMPSKLAYEHTQEVWCAREAMRFVDRHPEQPFFMQIAFQKPHHPLLPQQKFWDMYPDDLDLPQTVNQDPSHRPPNFRRMYEQYHNMTFEYAEDGEPWEVGARRGWRGTLACVTQIDDVFGMLLRDLESRDMLENTIIIYASDHGCYHGIHGIVEKAPGICSDAVCRVPMIWQVPGVTGQGQTCDQIVELIDLAPTLTELCGLPAMETVDGCDISGLLRGGDEPVRDAAVTENAWSRAVRFGKWRYVHYPHGMFPDEPDTGELYNMDDDPNETRNLYHDKSHQDIVRQAQRLLTDWLIRTTRLTTPQPAISTGQRDADWVGKHHYPIAGDGRAPNHIQPRCRNNNAMNYL